MRELVTGTMRRGGFWLLSFSILLAACGGGLPDSVQMPESPLLRLLERKSGQILYLGSDGNLYAIDQAGGNQIAITTDADLDINSQTFRQYARFAWSPDSEKIAFVGLTPEKVSIFVSPADGSERVELFSSDQDIPIYLYWTPDSQHISFLANNLTTQGLSLQMVPANGRGSAQVLSEGRPYYWAWEPQGTRLLAHIGGAAAESEEARLSLISPGSEFEREIELPPAYFQAPAWSPDGNQLMVAVQDVQGNNVLALTNLQGQIRQKLTTLDSSVAFSWSPDGKYVAYITSQGRTRGVLGRLTVYKPETAERIVTTDTSFVWAYFWSPDSRKIAYFTLELTQEETENGSQGNATPAVGLFVLDTKTKKTKNLLFFIPTPQFLEVLQVFDQYQRSATIWSPDSENIVVPVLINRESAAIVVLAASGNLEPRPIADGWLAFWSWK